MPQRKRIAFASNLFPDAQQPYRGLDNATVLHQLEPDYDIRVAAPRPTLPMTPWQPPAPRDIDQPFAPAYFRAPYIPKVGSHLNHHLMTRALRKAVGSLRETFEFDLLLASWLYPDGCAAVRVASELGVPAVLIAQGTDVHGYLKSSIRRPLILDAVNRAEATVTRSISLTDLLAEAGSPREKLHPIHNGADTTIFHPMDKMAMREELGITPEGPILLFVGNLLPVKNPLMLVDAWATACSDSKLALRLVMAGQGPLDSAIWKRAADHGLSDQLTLTGGIDSSTVARWMGAADLFCMTSHNEGLPNVVIESLACGLSILATDVGGIGELVDRDSRGSLSPPGDVEAYARKIVSLLAKGDQTDSSSSSAEEHSWSRCANQYRQVIDGALEGFQP